MLRLLYNLALLAGLILGAPFLALHALRGRSRSIARARLGLAPGWLPPPAAAGAVWLHALSVGEVLSALPLVRALVSRLPGRPLVLSLSTAQGLAVAQKELAGQAGVTLIVRTLDLPWLAGKVVRRMRPSLFCLVEGDIWPNLQQTLRRQGVPSLLVNARVSPRAFRRYQRLVSLARWLYHGFDLIAAQSELDRQRLLAMGVEERRLMVGGNFKFDSAPEPLDPIPREALALELGLADRQVLVAGSTHPGEEEPCLQAFASLAQERPRLALLLAPRDTSRGAEVAALAQGQGLRAARLSQGSVPDGTQVVVLDVMGRLAGAYALGRAAFVGGSLVSQGGHNPLEPAAQGVAALFGPHMEDFSEVAQDLVASGAARRLESGSDLASAWGQLLDDPAAARRMGQAGRELCRDNRGSVQRAMELIIGLLAEGQNG